MTGPLYAIGRWCSRHHWPVIGIWVVLAIALVVIGQASGSKTSENLTLPGTGSTQATELLEENLPQQAFGSNPLVLEAPAGAKLTESKYAKAVEETVKNLEALPDVNSATSPLAPGAQTLSQKSPNIGYIPVVLGVGPGEIAEDQSQAILDTAKPFEAAGGNASVGGYVGNQLSKPSTEKSELIGLVAAVIILLFAFGTATAMMLPISRRAGRARLHALDHPPARARARGPGRRLDPGDDDRARRRHRLRALHRHPAQTAAARRDGDAASRSPGRRRRRAAPSSSPASPW